MFNLDKTRSNSHDYPYVTMPPEIHIKSLLPLLTPICIPAASCLNYIVSDNRRFLLEQQIKYNRCLIMELHG